MSAASVLFQTVKRNGMETENNRKLMQDIFAGLEQGDGKLFVTSMAQDFCWHIIGSTTWSGSYRGKSEVRERLLKHLFARFAGRYTNHALRIIADGAYVAVECRGKVNTVSGDPYNNTYCWVCRIENGQLQELTEYMDTALVNSVLA
jgi:ketosteroid isomerase-like protein